jgi:hypothetical protein
VQRGTSLASDLLASDLQGALSKPQRLGGIIASSDSSTAAKAVGLNSTAHVSAGLNNFPIWSARVCPACSKNQRLTSENQRPTRQDDRFSNRRVAQRGGALLVPEAVAPSGGSFLPVDSSCQRIRPLMIAAGLRSQATAVENAERCSSVSPDTVWPKARYGLWATRVMLLRGPAKGVPTGHQTDENRSYLWLESKEEYQNPESDRSL